LPFALDLLWPKDNGDWEAAHLHEWVLYLGTQSDPPDFPERTEQQLSEQKGC
jgi:hypothetical protein